MKCPNCNSKGYKTGSHHFSIVDPLSSDAETFAHYLCNICSSHGFGKGNNLIWYTQSEWCAFIDIDEEDLNGKVAQTVEHE